MGICLDTEQQNGSQVFEDGERWRTGRWQGEAGLLSTPPDGNFPMQNIGQVNFESPKVPVIFVLGGPGSGKVTHCDNLMHEKKGITHINMTDLLQQYAMGNDMLDFGLLSSKTVTEVLMLEMKMSPTAKTYLVSGYPRNMRDVVEYSEKIQIVNGVVLVSWRQEILERQIDYGAQLGHVILGLARMELNNFYRNVMPVAEYFDQSGMLVAVNGERNPNEVYVDFREAVMKILGISDGSDRAANPPGSVEAEVKVERGLIPSSPLAKQTVVADLSPPPPPVSPDLKPLKTANRPRKGLPYFIWVIGGPGSNKAVLSAQAIANETGWVHISIGGLLRGSASTNSIVRDSILAGEMVPRDIVMQLVEKQVLVHRDTDGIVIDGFPRDSEQVAEFEDKFGQEPPLLLLDCSKLQLGRGRLDDSVSAFRRRLEIFRELSLPMLKSLDGENRLTIIDGDTDTKHVQDEFTAALQHYIQNASRQRNPKNAVNSNSINSHEPETKLVANNGVSNGITKNIDHMVNNLPVFSKEELSNGVSKNAVESIVNRVGKTVKERAVNGVNGVNGGINSISKQVQGYVDQGVKAAQENGVAKIGNGIANGGKQLIANGGTSIIQNGVANGIGHLVNGHLPTNKVAPVRNSIANNNNNIGNPVRNMYNEVESYQQDLHI
ncbi:adenylate kinase isoenzyme 5 [Athalia rosae]|uniref:adenylate kinase isoenzyme 5 n=1 Tax=Athalia rosae TaxID=37344 RepID=UPI0020337DF3|nr:adenylate kinase isoenzyme 5 [Athalia rosae]XP_048509023.1 adenylate kinase isoenzyme 5 [Athalia rosae]